MKTQSVLPPKPSLAWSIISYLVAILVLSTVVYVVWLMIGMPLALSIPILIGFLVFGITVSVLLGHNAYQTAMLRYDYLKMKMVQRALLS